MECIKNNIETVKNVASGLATGHTMVKVAKDNGISHATVSRMAAKPETKQIISAIRAKLIDKVIPQAAANVEHYVSNAITETDKDKRYWGCRYSEKLLESIGILGAPTPSFQTIINANQFNIATSVQNLLQTQGYSQLPIDSIDLPPIDGDIIDSGDK